MISIYGYGYVCFCASIEEAERASSPGQRNRRNRGTLARYLRLGLTLDLSFHFNTLLPDIIVLQLLIQRQRNESVRTGG
jgi:hypothetical protein